MEQKSYVFKFFIIYSFWNSEISAFYKLFEEMSRQLEGLRNEKCNLKKLLTPLWQILWKSEATLSYFEPQETSELVESLTLENSKAKDGKSLACCYNNINLATFLVCSQKWTFRQENIGKKNYILSFILLIPQKQFHHNFHL